jgi:4-diphosphocytidyl-2-C-methyl-D-erythritol kinase
LNVRITVPSFAKLNLDLRVLSKRPDGYHDLRTIFQTIRLKDSLRIDFALAKQTRIELDSSIEIAENLVVRAATLALERLKVKASVQFQLKKQIPLGAGLGGGSSNAAAVLLALPALAGRRTTRETLAGWAETLGSDVPFFLYGGTALGLGRGTELYPLPDLPAYHVLVISTGIHVSTAEAYAGLGRAVTNALTSAHESPILREFQAIAWALNSAKGAVAHRQSAMELSNISGGALDTARVLREFSQNTRLEQLPLSNDFETAVFKTHPELAAVARKLRRLGGKPAMMTGSGSAVFGIFASSAGARQAAAQFRAANCYCVRFLSRRQYQAHWRRALGTAAAFSCFSGKGRRGEM